MVRRIAIIGTAGRDPAQPMTKELWEAMVKDAKTRVDAEDFIFSGGAAWADHLAVELFLQEHVKNLSLWLAAPLHNNGLFEGPLKSAASASNFYHHKFSGIIGVSSRHQILDAQMEGAWINPEPVSAGYGAFFARNAKVAERAVDGCIAYTWGEDEEPADGGTKYTWDRIKGDRIHVPLRGLVK